MMVLVMAIVTASLFCSRIGAEALSAGSTASTTTVIIDVPPLVDVPVWSMATLNNDGGSGDGHGDENPKATTNMNLLTYATPISIRPNRLYALGLYKETKSRDNFLREKTCVLQLLSASNEKHTECVRLLGGTSGKDVSKEDELASVHGIELQELAFNDGNDNGSGAEQERLPKVLPGCVRYLQLSMVGDGVTDYDGGESSHDVVICKVDKMWTSSSSDSGEEQKSGNSGSDYLSTGRLRELGLITEQGRIVPMPEE
jgi:flavin reductase (DIM6/NTAB) family NADH-FMN oxidoreductase RutF